MSVFTGNGTGGFGARTDNAVGSQPLTLRRDHFNADDHLDVVTADPGSNTLTLRLGDGSGGFGPSTAFATGAGPVTVDSGA